MTAAVPRLHAPTDDQTLQRPDFVARALALMDAGAAVHLRSATLSARALLRLAEQLPGCWINDRADLARLCHAPGLHLPAAGLATADARALLQPGTLVGRSAHSVAEAAQALVGGADYVMLGPIWATPSHPDRAPLGVEALETATSPVIAVGGVTPERARACRAAGAYGVAAISALWNAADPAAAAAAMLLLLEV